MFENLGEKFMDYSGSIIQAIIILIVGLIIVKAILSVCKKALQKSKLDASIHGFILTAIKYLLYVVLLVVILSSLKVPTAPLVTVIGAAGAALALGLQGSLSNVAAGILILLNHPFKQGDLVDSNGYTGVVEEINITSTVLHTIDNRTVILPNSAVLGAAIVNNTAENIRRLDLQFGITGAADLDKAKEVLLDVCKKNQYVLDTPAPFIGVNAHGENGILIDVCPWVSTSNYVPASYELKEQVEVAFKEAGLTMPYNQIDVHLDK